MPIKIIIKSEGSENVKSINNPLNTATSKEQETERVDGIMSKEMAMITKFAISQAQSWAMQGIKTYTQFTGDTAFQKQTEFFIGALDNFATIYVGAKMGGSVGVGVAVAGIMAKEGLKSYSNYMEIKTHNRNLSIITKGLGTRNPNGGRYGT